MKEQEMRELNAWIAFNVTKTTTCLVKPTTSNDWLVARYTTNPAAAMMVLEKCAEIAEIRLKKRNGGDWIVAKYEDISQLWATAPTLPLAICLFAKQLFS